MLSRVAANLHWLGRYMERAENMARILETADRLAMTDTAQGESHWLSALVTSGCEPAFRNLGLPVTPENAVRYLALDPDNPSSIFSCLKTARENGRAVRTTLTSAMWEALNDTWHELQDGRAEQALGGDRQAFLEWVKLRSMLFLGATGSTMVRDEAFWFLRLGTYLERADNTARILDVKYHVLLPSSAPVGGSLDHYQWAAILRALSAYGSYSYIYREAIKPWLVAELLILRPELPRGLPHCLAEVGILLESLANAHGRRHECHRLAGELGARLRYGRMEDVFQRGLHEFLTDFVESVNRLGSEISQAYLQ